MIPAEDFNAYGIVGINLGVAYMYKGDLRQAEDVFMESAQRLQKAENYHGGVMALGFVSQVQDIFGKLHDAAATHRMCFAPEPSS